MRPFNKMMRPKSRNPSPPFLSNFSRLIQYFHLFKVFVMFHLIEPGQNFCRPRSIDSLNCGTPKRVK